MTLDISEFMRDDLVFLDVEARDKNDVFQKIIDGMARSKVINQPAAFLDEILERESQAPTCIGRGVALPHTRTFFVERPVIAFARTRNRVSFSQRPTDQVEFIFLMGTPVGDPDTYLHILGNLCRLLRENKFRDALRAAKSSRDVLSLFNRYYDYSPCHN